jgi:hypothetical protein
MTKKNGGKVISFVCSKPKHHYTNTGIQTNNHWSDVITKDKMHLLELIMCPEEQYGQFIS